MLLPPDVIMITSLHEGVISAYTIKLKKYLVTILSQDKKCIELAAIREALARNGINYQEHQWYFSVSEPGKIKPEKISSALSEINQTISFNPPSLQEKKGSSTPVSYIMHENGIVGEYTTADYGGATPYITYPQGGVGFDVFVPTNFGLRVHYISAEGVMVSDGGYYNSAFYSATVDKKSGLLLASAPGLWQVYSYDKPTGKLSILIDKYAVTNMRPSNDKLYFVGYQTPEEWNKAALLEYDFSTKLIQRLSEPIFADVRGMAFHDGKLYISDGAHNRLVVLDATTYKVLYTWLGFTYPNGISVTARGTLLVADEHAGVVRELNLQTGQEIRSVGYRLFRSPGYVEEINVGPYKSAWLVADTDNDRLLLLDPSSKNIHAEIGGLRGPLDFAVLPTK